MSTETIHRVMGGTVFRLHSDTTILLPKGLVIPCSAFGMDGETAQTIIVDYESGELHYPELTECAFTYEAANWETRIAFSRSPGHAKAEGTA